VGFIAVSFKEFGGLCCGRNNGVGVGEKGMTTVTCPLCQKQISHLNIKYENKLGAFCPICNGELSKEQVDELTEQYINNKLKSE
jgi:hypothetical protein